MGDRVTRGPLRDVVCDVTPGHGPPPRRDDCPVCRNCAAVRRTAGFDPDPFFDTCKPHQREAIADAARLRSELEQVKRERDRLAETLASRHGGDPLALLRELDAAREERNTLSAALEALREAAEGMLRRWGGAYEASQAGVELRTALTAIPSDLLASYRQRVLEEEREACARLCDRMRDSWRACAPGEYHKGGADALDAAGLHIRDRSLSPGGHHEDR